MITLSQLKLCFVAGTLEHGGAERQLFYIFKSLRQAGAAVRVLSLDRGAFWEEKIKTLGISVTWVGEHRSRLKRLFRIMNEVRKDPPDVLQSQHFYTNAYVGVAARLNRVVGIGAMRNDGVTEVAGSGPLGGWLNLYTPPTIAANSQIAIKYATAHGIPKSRLYFLPNVVDTDWFQPSNDISETPFTLIAVGRLVKQKRLERFIAIIDRLRSIYRLNVRGLIVGPGCQDEDLRPELETHARKLGLLPHIIRFCGGVSDMRPIYSKAAVCVLTSDFEGTPNVLLEAMASGLPVVSSNVGGVSGIVRHEDTGFLLEPDDVHGFATVLANLAKNSGLREALSRRARAFVEENHSLHRLPVYLDALYQKVLPLARRRPSNTVAGAAIAAGTRSPDRV
jgi:glycosyltransferase involved in cell wall biosynthesis